MISKHLKGYRMVNLRLCKTARHRFQNSTPRLRKIPPENDTWRPTTNASEILRSGQNFPRPSSFKEPFYTVLTIGYVHCSICFCLPFRFYCRLYIYPIKVLYSCGFDCRLYVPTAPFYFFFNTMLWILFAMNVWWFQYIVWLLIRIVTGMSRSVEDTREIPKRKTINGPKMVENEDMSNGSNKNHG